LASLAARWRRRPDCLSGRSGCYDRWPPRLAWPRGRRRSSSSTPRIPTTGSLRCSVSPTGCSRRLAMLYIRILVTLLERSFDTYGQKSSKRFPISELWRRQHRLRAPDHLPRLRCGGCDLVRRTSTSSSPTGSCFGSRGVASMVAPFPTQFLAGPPRARRLFSILGVFAFDALVNRGFAGFYGLAAPHRRNKGQSGSLALATVASAWATLPR